MPNTIQKGSEKEHYYLGNGQEIPNPRAVKIGDDETTYASGSGGINTTLGTVVTQTNTTQNKEELSEKDKFSQWACFNEEASLTGKQARLVWDYFKDQMAKSNEWWNEKLKQSLSQAHQSGIEEERKRIAENFKKICVVNNGGDCKYWDIKKLGYSNDEKKICGYAKFFPQDVLDEILKK